MDNKETLQKVKELRPIDDAFFEKLMESRKVCEEILRVILGDGGLTVLEVIPQRSIKNLVGRSVRLDAICVLGNGTYCNIEVQKADDDDHVRRARYNASSITASKSITGTKFRQVPSVIEVFITKFDIFGFGRNIYHVESVIKETGTEVDDGLREIFVNTAIKDDTTLSELMDCFMQQNVDNPKFPCLSHEVRYYKTDQKGVQIMCEIIETYAQETAAKEKAVALVKYVDSIMKTLDCTIEKACEVMGEDLSVYLGAKALLEKTDEN